MQGARFRRLLANADQKRGMRKRFHQKVGDELQNLVLWWTRLGLPDRDNRNKDRDTAFKAGKVVRKECVHQRMVKDKEKRGGEVE